MLVTSSYRYKETLGQRDAPLVFTFHGTGGTADQFHDLATQLIPDAHVISPEGDVLEMGMQRFFRRTGEGVYDMDDLAQRTDKMAAFVTDHVARIGAKRVVGLGYSNGANIVASVILAKGAIFTDAVLMHPLIPWSPTDNPDLAGQRLLITAGKQDPICPAPQSAALESHFKGQGAEKGRVPTSPRTGILAGMESQGPRWTQFWRFSASGEQVSG